MSNELLDTFDRFGEAFQQNPFPFYDAMRAASPAWFHAPSNMYFITSYEHVNAVVKNPTVFSSEYGVSANEPPQPHIAEQIAEIKNMPVEALLSAVRRNSMALFFADQ